MSRYGAALNHELPLPAATTLADALHAKRLAARERAAVGSSTLASARLALAPDSDELRKLIQEQARDQARDAQLSIVTPDVCAQLEAALASMETRRGIAHSVASRLKGLAARAPERQARDLRELPEEMFMCRLDGDANVDDEGGLKYAWVSKCESTKFCPDCARAHAMYEALRYTPTLVDHVTTGHDYRAHFAVFTRPSVPIGKMAEGIAETFKMFRDFLDLTVPCTNEQREKYGWSKRKRTLPLWQLAKREKGEPYTGPGLHGALVQLECHLTAKGMWHPHLNVILLTRGDFSYSVVRDAWGYNVELQQIEPRPGESVAAGFARAFRETIKYPFRHVGEKNLEKRAAGETDAPAFEHWPDEAILEWHAATRRELDEEGANGTRIHGSRWLRSYGVLHGLPPPDTEQREVRRIARLTFNDDGRYFVGFIPPSKFSRSHQKGHVPGYRVPDIRPPPRAGPAPPRDFDQETP